MRLTPDSPYADLPEPFTDLVGEADLLSGWTVILEEYKEQLSETRYAEIVGNYDVRGVGYDLPVEDA